MKFTAFKDTVGVVYKALLNLSFSLPPKSTSEQRLETHGDISWAGIYRAVVGNQIAKIDNDMETCLM